MTVFDQKTHEEPPTFEESQYSIKSFADCQNTAFGSPFNAEEFLVLLYDGKLQSQTASLA